MGHCCCSDNCDVLYEQFAFCFNSLSVNISLGFCCFVFFLSKIQIFEMVQFDQDQPGMMAVLYQIFYFMKIGAELNFLTGKRAVFPF